MTVRWSHKTAAGTHGRYFQLFCRRLITCTQLTTQRGEGMIYLVSSTQRRVSCSGSQPCCRWIGDLKKSFGPDVISVMLSMWVCSYGRVTQQTLIFRWGDRSILTSRIRRNNSLTLLTFIAVWLGMNIQHLVNVLEEMLPWLWQWTLPFAKSNLYFIISQFSIHNY